MTKINKEGMNMDRLIGLFIVLCIVRHFTNKATDNMRVKKWWDEGGKDGKNN